jgi:predicted dehydrogenase
MAIQSLAPEKIGIGIVGLRFGSSLIEKQLLKGEGRSLFNVAAVCDLNAEVCATAARRFNAKPYPSLEALIEDPAISAVGLFTPPTNRADLIRQIIRAGKHVMTTKPLEMNAEAALRVLHEANDLRKVVHLNSPSPLPHPHIRQIFQWHEQYALGHPVGARYEVWCSYRERPDGRPWMDDPVQCPAAPILRLGIYGVNDLCRLFGQPETIQLSQSRLFTERPTADNANLTIGFMNGAIASVFASFCINDRRGYRSAMCVNYANGSIWVDETGLRLRTQAAGGEPITASAAWNGTNEDYQWGIFARAIGGEIPDGQITPADAIAGVRVVQALGEAQATGCQVRLQQPPNPVLTVCQRIHDDGHESADPPKATHI